MDTSPVSLAEVRDPTRFGGKATQLARACAASLPVPPGVAFARDVVDALLADPALAERALAAPLARLGGRVAVRASGTVRGRPARACLNVVGTDAAVDALRTLRAVTPGCAVIVQQLVDADVAGVLVTRHPVSGADERVIESTWGLGEGAIAGRVTPDVYRVARGGRLLDRQAGRKPVAVRAPVGGGLEEVAVDETRAHAASLGERHIAALDALATACEVQLDGARDLEWAFADGRLYLIACHETMTL